jgi:hypothetical protein
LHLKKCEELNSEKRDQINKILDGKNVNLMVIEINDLEEKIKLYVLNIELDPDNAEDWNKHV